MKKILYFFPDDIANQDAGNKTRALYLLKYFTERGFAIDYVSVKDELTPDIIARTDTFFKANHILANVFLLPRKPGKSKPLTYFLRYKIWDLLYYLFTYPLRSSIPTYLTLTLKKAFNNILKANSYDFIIISYVHSADLITDKALTGKAKTIVDTHDFLTAQFKNKKGFDLGTTFQDEIERINTFDEVWAIAPEEDYIFKHFCKTQVRHIPMMMDLPGITQKPLAERKYDIIYVGNDNEHNILSIKWFFKEVYPLLPPGLCICFIGKINNYIPDGYAINRVLFAESLDGYYKDSKIAICPMLQGTGVKVKVVEALAFGLPVVCTQRGTDGLPNKYNNGCMVSDDAARFAQNITALLKNYDLYSQYSQQATDLFKNSFAASTVFTMLDRSFT